MKPYPELTVRCRGDRWKARVNVHVLMTGRTLSDTRQFVKLYIKPMLDYGERAQVVKQILDWFTAAIEVARENWKEASQNYVRGYKLSWDNPYSLQPTKKQATENKKLLTAVEQAKKAMDKLEKQRETFIGECHARKVEVPAS